MFQKSRPAVSNRFQCASSTISMSKRFMASVILRVPPSKTCCSFAAALVRQQAHNGSSPCADCGVTTSAPLARARSAMYISHSLVRNGMSHPIIKFHSAPPPVSLVVSNAVMIPASGPWPSQRSLMSVMPSPAYLCGAAITVTSFVTSLSSDCIRRSIGVPPILTSALSRPKRVLPPPAKTYPNTGFVFVPSLPTPRLCLSSSLLPQSVRARAGEFQAPAIFPASSAGATQLSLPFAKHSNDDRQAASLNTPPRTSASPRESPSRPARCRALLRNAFAPAPRRARLRPVNPRRRSLPRGRAPDCARARSSIPAHFPANRNAQRPQSPRASVAPPVPVAPQASAKKIPPAREYPAYVRAVAAVPRSPHAAGRTNPLEISRPEFRLANSGASH